MNDKDWIKNIYLPRLKGKVLYIDSSTTDSLHKYAPNSELFETIDTGDFMGFKREYKYDHISMHSSWGDLMFIKHGAWYENSGSKTKLHRLKLEMTQSIINMVCKAHNMLNEGGTLQMGPILNTPESMDGIYDYLNNNGYHTIFREYGAKKGFYGNYIFWGIKKNHYDLQREIITFGPRMAHDDTIDALAYACLYARPNDNIKVSKEGSYYKHKPIPKSWIVA